MAQDINVSCISGLLNTAVGLAIVLVHSSLRINGYAALTFIKYFQFVFVLRVVYDEVLLKCAQILYLFKIIINICC